MDKDDLSTLLTRAAPTESVTVAAEHLRSMFAHGIHRAGEPIERRIAQFAEDHDCDFVLDRKTGNGRFLKRAHLARDTIRRGNPAGLGFLRDRPKR